MSYFISVSDTVRDHFLDESNLRYLRVVIDPDGTPATYTPRDISCDASEDYQKWSFSIKNRTGLSVGLHANMAATVDVSHNGSTWLTVFTGFVSDDGFNRHRGLVTDDYLSLDLVDATKRKGTKRKPNPVLLSSFTASDPSAESSSVLHYLANQMGVTVEAAEIDHTIDLIELGKNTVWAELQALRDAYHADMYFRYDGKLLFHSPFDTGYSAPPSEWTFQGDPAQAVSGAACRIYGVVSEAYVPVRCNYARTSFDDYELLTERIVYKNTEAFDETSGLISIALDAGAYWPGPAATDVARLEYKDPESGADYPFAIDIVTPTLGAAGSGADIESTGGSLEIISLNGSTSATTAEGGATQLILHNNSAEPCTIRKLTVRGKPYQLKEQVKVEHVDAAVTDAVNYVEQEVNGRYASDASQMFDTLYYMVEEGKGRPRQFAFAAPFMPWIQRRAIVTVQMPGEEAVRCRIDTYAHRNRGKTMQGMHTTLVCTELGTHTPTGSPYVETTPAIPAWQAKLTSIAPNAGATYRSASTSAPVSPKMGDWWYQTDTRLSKRYDGLEWQDVGASPLTLSTTAGVDFENSTGNVRILSDGTLEAIDAKLTGTLKTGTDAPIDARVGIRDAVGITSGPTFVGTGLNDMSITVEGTVAVTARVKIETTPTVYALGDTGPAGGKIFYIANGIAYEASLEAKEDELPFGGSGTSVSTSEDIGTGNANTEAIVAALGSGTYSARYCSDLSYGGYSDWYLPSIDEVEKLYQGRVYLDGADLGAYYLSSSQASSTLAFAYVFAGGTSGGIKTISKSATTVTIQTVITRPIRSFSIADTFKVSVDDGSSYGSEITIPASRTYNIPDKEITIAFASINSHTVGDYWRFVQSAMRGLAIQDSDGNEYLSASNGVVTVTGSVSVTGAISAATIDTGNGATEVYDMNQDVKTTDSPTFAGLTVSGDLVEQSTTQWSLGSQSINYGASYVLPRGVYQIYRRSASVTVNLEVKDASTWYTVGDVFVGGGYVASDGTNMRLTNASEDTNATIYWRKKP